MMLLLMVDIGLFLILAMCDWLMQFNSPLGRWICTLLLSSGFLYCCWFFLIRVWLRPISLLDVALQCERLNPELQGRLATAIARNEPVDSPAANLPLRMPQLRLAPMFRVSMALIALVTFAVWLAWRAPQWTQIAVARLLLPADSIRWPRQTDLQLMTGKGTLLTTAAPLMIDTFQPLTLYVRDSEGEAPTEIYWETKDSLGRIGRHPVRRSDGTERRYDFRFTWLPPAGISWVRVAGGGDHSMGWCPLESRTAPALAAITVQLKYPEYLNLPARTLESLPAKLSVPVGTQLELRGKLDRNVIQVRRVTPGARPQLMQLNAAGDSFEWRVSLDSVQREVFWFEPIDAAGLTTSRPIRHELITLADALPEARFSEPAADLYMTAIADVPVELICRDDHSIRRVELLAEHEGTTYVCWQQDWTAGDLADATISLNLRSESPEKESNSNVIHWSGETIREGQQIRIEVRAYDFLPAADRFAVSSSRVLRIVSAVEKLRELQQRVRTQHERIHTYVGTLIEWHADHRQLDRPETDRDVARLHEMQWQQYRQLLLHGSQLLRHELGVTTTLQATVSEAERNRLDADELAIPLLGVITQLNDLTSHELAAAELTLLQVDRVFASLNDRDALDSWFRKSAPGIARMELAESSLLRAWQEIEDSLSRWSNRRDSLEELDRLLAEFERIRGETLPLAQRTVALSAAQLSPTDRTELADLASQHLDLANGYQRTLDDTTQPASNAGEHLAEFQQRIKGLQVVPELQEIGALLGRNNIGQALQKQSDLLRELDEAYQQMRGNSLTDAEMFRQQIDEQTRRAEDLFIKQQTLGDDVARLTYSEEPEARAELERLIKEHERQSLDQVELSRHLRQMGMRPQGQRIDMANDALGRSRLLLPLQQKEEALTELELAEQQLGEVLQDLRRQHDRLEQESLAARAGETGVLLSALADRQAWLAEETSRLRTIMTERGRWTRGELKSLSDASESERQLVEELLQARLRLTNLSLFQAITDDIVRGMRESEERLRGRDVSMQTEELQIQSARQLAGLAQALQVEPNGESNGDPSAPTSPESNAESARAGTLTASQVAEFRLIIALQLQLADETEALLVSDSLSANERERRLEEIAAEQLRLTKWLTALLKNEAVEVVP